MDFFRAVNPILVLVVADVGEKKEEDVCPMMGVDGVLAAGL